MKPISSELLAHLSGEVTTLTTCWKITRRDSMVLGFTSFDKDIIFEGVTYFADSGFTPTSVNSDSELSADKMEIEGVIDGVFITEPEIEAGIYDYSEIEIFMVNFNDLSQGKLNLRTGWMGEVKYGNGRFSAEIGGLMQALSQIIGSLYSPSCRAKLCDAKCGLSEEDYIATGIIDSVINNQIFNDSSRAEEDGYFTTGKITFNSGANAGISMEVKEYIEGVITLVFPMPYSVEEGDIYSIFAGCDKSFATCVSRFNNAINFRGEPHVPGVDSMLKTAGTR